MKPIRFLMWDDFNLNHIVKHNVLGKEVEEVCKGGYIAQPSYDGRFLVIGPTTINRILAVAIAPKFKEKGVFYPITARPASRKERNLYQQIKGKGVNVNAAT